MTTSKLTNLLLDSSTPYLHSSSEISTSSSTLFPSSSSSTSTELSSSSVFNLIKILTGIFLVVVIFVSVFGNLLVCVAIFWDRRLRRLGNFFIVSLAIADLFVGALVMTFALANDLLDYWPFGPTLCELWIGFDISCSTCSIINLCAIALDRFAHIKDPMRYNRWMTKRIVILCITGIWLVSFGISFVPISLGWHKPDYPIGNSKFEYSTISTQTTVSTQTTISTPTTTFNPEFMERLFELSHHRNHNLHLHRHLGRNSQSAPYNNNAKLNPRISTPLISSTTSTSNSFNFDNNTQQYLPQCALDLTLTYAVVSSIISFYLPCVIMVYLYLKLYSICQQHVKNIKSMTKFLPQIQNSTPLTMTPVLIVKNVENSNSARISVSSNTVPIAGPASESGRLGSLGSQSQASEHKAAVTLGIIMGTFLACWMPFFCINIVAAYCKTCIPLMVFKSLTWLGYFNSCLNPAIYSIFNTEFRDAFRRILVRYLFNEDTSAVCSRLVPCKATPRSSTSTTGSQNSQQHFHQQHQNGSKNHFNVMTCPLNTQPNQRKLSINDVSICSQALEQSELLSEMSQESLELNTQKSQLLESHASFDDNKMKQSKSLYHHRKHSQPILHYQNHHHHPHSTKTAKLSQCPQHQSLDCSPSQRKLTLPQVNPIYSNTTKHHRLYTSSSLHNDNHV